MFFDALDLKCYFCIITVIILHLPDDMVQKIQLLSNNMETYLLDLLQAKINEQDKQSTLAKQYRLACKENSILMKEFLTADLEGWEDEY